MLLRRRLLQGRLLQNLLLAGRLRHGRHGCDCLLGGRRRLLGGRRTMRKELLRRELLLLHRRLRLMDRLHQRDRGWSLRLQRGLGEQDERGWSWNLRQEGGWDQDWSHVCHVREHGSHRVSFGGHLGGHGLQDRSWTRLQVSRSGPTAASAAASWSCDSNHRGGWRTGPGQRFSCERVNVKQPTRWAGKGADQETKKSPSQVCA